MTGRPRRCGWLDLPLLRYSNQINGTDWLVVTKLDVLDELDQIRVCVAYEVNGEKITHMPASTRRMEVIKPIFEMLPGWKKSTAAAKKWSDLPQKARDYLKAIADLTGAKLAIASVGPGRDQTIVL